MYKIKENISKKRLKPENLNKRYIFQKTAICIATLLWLITAANVLWREKDSSNDNRIISAFSSNIYSDMESQITTIGKYGNVALTDTAKKVILKKIAEKIGINKYEISSSEENSKNNITLQQDCINGKVLAKFITIVNDKEENTTDCSQYIYIGINLNNSIESAFSYEKIVKDIVKELGLNSTVTVNLKGEIKGKLDNQAKDALSEQLLTGIGAKNKAKNDTNDIYTVYAYDKDIEEYIKIGSGKVNVNITMSYDQQKDATIIYFSTPVNNQDY